MCGVPVETFHETSLRFFGEGQPQYGRHHRRKHKPYKKGPFFAKAAIFSYSFRYDQRGRVPDNKHYKKDQFLHFNNSK